MLILQCENLQTFCRTIINQGVQITSYIVNVQRHKLLVLCPKTGPWYPNSPLFVLLYELGNFSYEVVSRN